MKIILTAISVAALLFVGAMGACTATDVAHMTKYGQPARVTCQSGNVIYFDDESTGAVSQHAGGDISFVSATTNRLTQAMGACIIDYGGHLGPTGAVRPHEVGKAG